MWDSSEKKDITDIKLFFIDELFQLSTTIFQLSPIVPFLQLMGFPKLVFRMVRTEICLIPVTEDNLNIETFLSESTMALTFLTSSFFSGLRGCRPAGVYTLAVTSLLHWEFIPSLFHLELFWNSKINTHI